MIPPGYETDSVVQMETNLDDTTPELLGYVSERLRELGALDVWLTPIQMKKNRPGVMLSLLCEKDKVSPLCDTIFRETSAFGLRLTEVQRIKLQRDFVEVPTPLGTVILKRGFRAGELLQIAPEYESCRAIAQQTGEPLHHVYHVAREAAGRTVSPQS